MSHKIKFGIGLALTVPLNVAFPYAIQFLVGLDWHFLFYIFLVGGPLGVLSILAGILIYKNVPWPPAKLLASYLVLTLLNFTAWVLYSLYKAATIRWGGH